MSPSWNHKTKTATVTRHLSLELKSASHLKLSNYHQQVVAFYLFLYGDGGYNVRVCVCVCTPARGDCFKNRMARLSTVQYISENLNLCVQSLMWSTRS